MTRIKKIGGILLLAATAVFAVQTASAVTPAERREELLKVQELVNDPDPLMRIANFEEIIRSKDAFKVETAIKIAMASQDSNLRGLATRAYFAAFKVVMFDPVLPADLARKWESSAGDSEALRRLASSNKTLQTVYFLNQHGGGRVRFLFEDVEPSQNQGKVAFTRDGVKADQREVVYRVLGERVVFTSNISFAGYTPSCDVELRGTKELKLTGKITCQHPEVGPIDIEAAMF